MHVERNKRVNERITARVYMLAYEQSLFIYYFSILFY